jgi:ATP-binding cassette, subfamily B, bacterial
MARLGATIHGVFARTERGAGSMGTGGHVPVREIFRRFWPYARPYRRYLWLTLAFVACDPAIETVTIWLYKLLIDDVLVPRDFAPFIPLVLAYFGLTIGGGLISFCDDYLAAWVAERFLLALRTSFFRHLQGLSLDFFEGQRLGDVISRLTGDVAAIEDLMLTAVASVLSYALRILFFGGALFYLRWDLALASLIVSPFFWFTSRRSSARIKRASREKRRRSGAISAVAEESLANAALVQAYNRQEAEVGRFHREGVGALAAQMAAARLKALYTPLIDLIDLAGVLVVIGIGTWELMRGAISLGGLMVFLTYLSRLYGPIRGLGGLMNTVHAAAASGERIIEFLDREPAVRERPDARRLPRGRGALTIDEVSFRYPGATRDAVHGIAFACEPGQIVALVGPSGAGKSTLVKLLLRFYDPDAGRVLLDGEDLRDVRLDSLRENVAVVLQETLIFDGTVRENIAYGRPGAAEAEIIRAAQAADADRFVRALPDGYDTVVGQKGRRLSGGQRQRIAIARAMIRDAPVLILDEPTTGLDAESGERILAPLRRLMSGRTTLVISHNLLTVREANMILTMEEGRVVERGTHAELLLRGGRYAQLYRLHERKSGTPPPDGPSLIAAEVGG